MKSKSARHNAPHHDIETILRSYILSPYCIGLALIMAFLITLLPPRALFFDLSVSERAMIHLFNVALFMSLTYLVMPMLFRTVLERGWPILWVQVALYLPLVAVLAPAFTLLDGAPLALNEVAWRAAILVTWTALSSMLGLMGFWLYCLPESGIELAPRQIWFFHHVDRPPCRLQDHLSPEVRGYVQHMIAENQYVRVVTDHGEELIRLTLAQAVALVPDDAGLRIHRSHWISTGQIAALRFESGNPRLTTADGQQLPVSRSRVADVRRVLETAKS